MTDNERMTEIREQLKKIQALCENPYWTSERRWHISEIAQECIKLIHIVERMESK